MWWVIIALLILVVRAVIAQASEAMQVANQKECYPAMVQWQTDSLKVSSFGCIDSKADTLIIIPHIVNGEPKGAMFIPKKFIKSITLLKPDQRADMKPRA